MEGVELTLEEEEEVEEVMMLLWMSLLEIQKKSLNLNLSFLIA